MCQNVTSSDTNHLLLAAALYRAAASQQHPHAIYNLALMYSGGEYGTQSQENESGELTTTRNYEAAAKLFQQAIDLKVPFALTNLGKSKSLTCK